MNDSIYRVCLDIHTIASQLMLDIKENDVGRRIVFTLTEAGKPYELTSDCSAVFRAKKPDGTVLFNGCVMKGNIIEYTLTAQTSAAVGILECELTIYGANNKQITSPRFEMRVEGNVATDSEIESQDEFTALNEAINAVETLDLEVTKEEHTTTVMLVKKDGTIEEVEILDGEKGDKGDKGDTGEVSEEELQEVINQVDGLGMAVGNLESQKEERVTSSDGSVVITRNPLTLETDLKVASGGGSLYVHHVELYCTRESEYLNYSAFMYITLFSNSSTPLTYIDISGYIGNGSIQASGFYDELGSPANSNAIIYHAKASYGSILGYYRDGHRGDAKVSSVYFTLSETTITDYVKQIGG